jgi:hypothetical protein
MKTILKPAIAAAFLICTAPVFACDYPTKIVVPNGTTATKDEMLEGQKAVKQYVADMEAYLDCIVAEEQSARSEMDDLDAEAEQQREDMLNKKYNAAVEEMETIAAAFNSEVQAYKARNQ